LLQVPGLSLFKALALDLGYDAGQLGMPIRTPGIINQSERNWF
jgi:hypothetical protein